MCGNVVNPDNWPSNASVCARSSVDHRPIGGTLNFLLVQFFCATTSIPKLTSRHDHHTVMDEFSTTRATLLWTRISHLHLDPIVITARDLANILGMGSFCFHFPVLATTLTMLNNQQPLKQLLLTTATTLAIEQQKSRN